MDCINETAVTVSNKFEQKKFEVLIGKKITLMFQRHTQFNHILSINIDRLNTYDVYMPFE